MQMTFKLPSGWIKPLLNELLETKDVEFENEPITFTVEWKAKDFLGYAKAIIHVTMQLPELALKVMAATEIVENYRFETKDATSPFTYPDIEEDDEDETELDPAA